LICRIISSLALTFFAASVFAIDSEQAFNNPDLQARYENLIAEVRCVTCQNQNIKDSNAFIAADLRREIRRMIREGLNNNEIKDFLVTRYGDFVLYRPRYEGKAIILWIAPFLFFVFGGIAVVRVIRYRANLPIDEALDKDGPNQ